MQIEGYRLVRQIGAGGMGVVHEAYDADGNRVAVKILHEAIAADPAARTRLRREVELLHRVRDAGVARVLDAEVDGATAFVVTELVDGPTLEDDVREQGPLEGAELAGLAHGLAEGLHAIHTAGITHRDLKPGNVMLSPRGPVIIDFGIAQVADDVRLTQTGMVTGTPGYLDPDVIAGADPGPAGDWWAWAAVITFAATGRPPFGRGGMQAVLARVSTGVVDVEGLPERLGRVLHSALDPQPARRLTPRDVLAALDGDWQHPALVQLLSQAPPTTPRTDVLPPSLPPAVRVDGSGPTANPTRMLASDYPPSGHAAGQPSAPGYAGVFPEQQGWYPPAGPMGQMGPVEPPPWARPAPGRPWTVAALGLGLSTLAVLVPGWWLVSTVVLLVLLATVGRGARRLRQLRHRRGLRRGDSARAWLGSPLHLLWAAGALIPGFLIGGILAGGTWWVTHALLDLPEQILPWLLWGAAALGLTLAWTVPRSAAARGGARTVLATVPAAVRTVVVLGVLVAAAVLGVVLLSGGVPEPLWVPLPEPF